MKKYSLLLFSAFLLVACAGRVPSTETAQDIVRGYFNKYGKKYKETPFGSHSVKDVQILSMEEIQRHLSYGSALVSLDNGDQIKINMNFLYKSPLGWRQQGWEMVSNSDNPNATLAPLPVSLPEATPPTKKK